MTSTHPRHENFPWTIVVVDHPPRKQTKEYLASRKLMRKIVAQVDDWLLGPPPYEDHHGGAVWVKDTDGWLCVQLPLGIEWSAQFAADPQKVDKLRLTALRVVNAFPATLKAYAELGYTSGRRLLQTPITTSRHVARWTDSIFNASMPLPRMVHTGVLPKGAGYHHYPKPIVDIEHFKKDGLPLFIDDDDGHPIVIVPASGSPNSRGRLIAAHPDSAYAPRLARAKAQRQARPHEWHFPYDAEIAYGGGAGLDFDAALPPGQPTYDVQQPKDATLLPASNPLVMKALGRS